jgi:hypothetical protein
MACVWTLPSRTANNARMNRPVILSASISVALLLAGCESLPENETSGPFRTGAAEQGGEMARAAGGNNNSLVAGSSVTSVAIATVHVIAKHQADERQRQVAIERARAAQAKIAAQQKHAEEAAKKSGKKYVAKKAARYIAVDTVKNAQTSPGARKAVMIWDTQSEQIVGNNVYDVESAPSVGQTARFETVSAEYVGGS